MLHGVVPQNSTIPTQHSSYTEEMATLFAEINSITDNSATPTYSDPDKLIQALQGLHLSEILEFDDDGADEDRQNDIDISRMNTSTMDVPPMEFKVDEKSWESSGNRTASR